MQECASASSSGCPEDSDFNTDARTVSGPADSLGGLGVITGVPKVPPVVSSDYASGTGGTCSSGGTAASGGPPSAMLNIFELRYSRF